MLSHLHPVQRRECDNSQKNRLPRLRQSVEKISILDREPWWWGMKMTFCSGPNCEIRSSSEQYAPNASQIR
ncbi:hypothetical protein M408DRAFT_271583 [Serendipita vermifera MAFF 305830]|uniref:Uncharacterized protein n=1 Tax=Serendipita vermifera MAFF 305830 TaxID=933852 RepID=A0A0C2WXK1_SERVB|nr:hypothetical protein M408DRAFT_271583 [Serendipita vermifera MAFF 305830]